MQGSLHTPRIIRSRRRGFIRQSYQKGTVSIPEGVPSLRAGEGNSFLLRRLHSLSGIIPIGAFLLEHFISNSEAMNGATAYNDQVKFLTGLPFVARAGVGIHLPAPALPRALRLLHLVSRRVERRRVPLDRQLAVHLAALDRHDRLLLHRATTCITCASAAFT